MNESIVLSSFLLAFLLSIKTESSQQYIVVQVHIKNAIPCFGPCLHSHSATASAKKQCGYILFSSVVNSSIVQCKQSFFALLIFIGCYDINLNVTFLSKCNFYLDFFSKKVLTYFFANASQDLYIIYKISLKV